MTDWTPATEAEAAMRDALAASDQELYFRVLSRSDLLLPVSAEALAGNAPMGWGTWTTGTRTHVLAFTSPDSLYRCLNEPGGSYRVIQFHRLAADWPNYEWWLAVNPGLPIEAYLPSWFVSQLTRGEVRLPGRTMGARARIAQGDLAAALTGRVRAVGPVPPTSAPIPTQVSASVVPGFASGAETVDAEIVDYPPVSATARVQASAPVTPARPPAPAPPPPPPPPPAYRAESGARPGLGALLSESLADAGPEGYSSDYAEPEYSSGGYGAARDFSRPPPEPPQAGYKGMAYSSPTYSAPRYEPPMPEPDYGVPAYGPTPGFTAPAGYDSPTYVPPASPEPPPTYPTATGYAASSGYSSYEPSFVDPDATTRIPPSSVPPARETMDAEIVPTPGSWAVDFAPANETESNLLAAAEENNTDSFLSTLLLARVILPVPAGTPNNARPRDPSFPWQIETADGQRFIAVFTSPERLEEHTLSRFTHTVSLRFVQLIGGWPDGEIAFAINPGSPVGATLPGSQIIALASWAREVGLRDEPSGDVVVAAKKNESTPVMGVAGAPANGADRATVMQRTVPHGQVPYYLERGYDRVSGFVNRASEVAHLTSPKALYRVLGLVYPGSAFTDDDTEVHVVRWVAHRSDLYRLPYGGSHEAGMRAMQGWVIERPPFRGNGFAPGDGEIVSEFKVDSIRLPHGAQMWRLSKDGSETLVASFDADTTRWVSGPLYGGGRA